MLKLVQSVLTKIQDAEMQNEGKKFLYLPSFKIKANIALDEYAGVVLSDEKRVASA
jgi:ribosomal protein S8